jgi:hypothetical protein
MGIHSNQSWLVFQSPILQDPIQTQLFEQNHSKVFLSADYFFQSLFENIGYSEKKLLTVYSLSESFQAFKTYCSPTHYRALFAFLMECRANSLDEAFIESLQDLPLSSNLQQLFFLYYEFLLFKKNNTHLCDPWDILQSLTKENLTFTSLTWIDFKNTTTFNRELCKILAKLTSLTINLKGPSETKHHTFSLLKFSDLMARLKNSSEKRSWILGPTALNLQAHIQFLLEGHCLFSPTAFESFDDIHGYLSHEYPPKITAPNHEFSADLHSAFVEDHVLPETLTEDSLWKSQKHALSSSQALLWTQHLALLESTTIFNNDAGHILIQPHCSDFPTLKELTFLKDSSLNCTISPQFMYSHIQTPTIVWLPSP